MGLARHAWTIAALSMLFGAVSLLREQATAYRFGSGIEFEAFVIAYALPAFLVNTAAGVLGPVFTPILMQIRHRETTADADDFVAAVLGASIAVGVIVSAVLAASAPQVLPLFAAGFDAEKLARATELLYWLLPLVVASSVAFLWAALLNADQRFGYAAFAPTLQPLGALLGVVMGGTRFGVTAMAVGMTCGAIAQAMLLAWAVSRSGHGLRIARPRRSPFMSALARQYGALFAGSVLLGGTTLVNQGMATTISHGAVAHLAFANVAVVFVLGLGARTVGQVLLPHFSRFAAAARWGELRSEVNRTIGITFACSAAVAVVLALSSAVVVRVLFERGAFTAADTETVAQVQRYLAAQIPWYLGGIVTARLLTSLQMTRHMLWIAAVGLVLTVALNLALIGPLGIRGIALGVTVVNAVCFTLSRSVALRRLALLESSSRSA